MSNNSQNSETEPNKFAAKLSSAYVMRCVTKLAQPVNQNNPEQVYEAVRRLINYRAKAGKTIANYELGNLQQPNCYDQLEADLKSLGYSTYRAKSHRNNSMILRITWDTEEEIKAKRQNFKNKGERK